MPIQFKYYFNESIITNFDKIDTLSQQIISICQNPHHSNILSESQSFSNEYDSNAVLKELRNDLMRIGFDVETDKKIKLYHYYPDAYSASEKYVIEVEAARGYLGNQFLKDYFKACHSEGVEYLCIMVRNRYDYGKTKKRQSENYRLITEKWFDVFLNKNCHDGLKGLLVIGY